MSYSDFSFHSSQEAHYGTWTSKPAPLYFEQALKEYLADYSYDLAEADDGAQEEGLDGADEE